MINEDNTILMNEQNDNTVVNEQPAAQPAPEQPAAQPKKAGVSRAALIASTAFAAAFGAGAAHAANALLNNDNGETKPIKPILDEEDEDEQEEHEQHEEQPVHTTGHQTNNAHTSNGGNHTNNGSGHTNNGGNHTDNGGNNNHTIQHEEQHEIAAPTQPSFYNGREVSIERIESVVDDETGEVIHVAYGTVDGHCAILVDDGEGNIQVGLVDYNDNGSADEAEVIDFEGSGVNMSNLAEHMTQDAEVIVEVEDPLVTTGGDVHVEHEVEVIAVEHDVEMGGGLVDVAVLDVDGATGLIVDADQDGMGDLLVVDVDHSGSFDENEIADIEGEGLVMPNEADVTGNAYYASMDDEGPDYINDGNVDSFA